MYCLKCGTELPDGAQFCMKCGANLEVKNKEYENNGKREQTYVGKVNKCPCCGEILESFVTHCSACGYELRGVCASSAIREFALKLESIEAKREYEKPRGFLASSQALQQVSKTDEQKISLIKSFAVPNSKEDMLEFMILATSSMNMRIYDSTNADISKGEKEINAAWFSKVEQVYEKAKRIYSTDNTFIEIKELYDRCNEKIRKAKKKGIVKWVLMLGWVPILWIVVIVSISISEPKKEAEEIERLEKIVIDVQEALGNKEYKYALSLADSIDYQRGDAEMERKWDIEREYWIDKVITTASDDGVVLQYTPSEDIDNSNDDSNDKRDDETTGGFIGGLQSGVDSIEENIDEFNSIMSGDENIVSE